MKSRRKKKPKKTGRKGIYILPNLFTSACLFGGFYAIIAAIQGRYEAAAIAIIISAIFDGLDGRIARFTYTTSHFGYEYDSLADLVSFGIAPGVLAYLWALGPFGRLGWLASFMYVICGALRLARFNVQQSSLGANYFKGLPIPAAACSIASFILFTKALSGFTEHKSIIVLAMLYVLSFLMVSTINFLSFKEYHIGNRKPFNILVSLILISLVIAYKPKVILFFIVLFYILSGPILTLYRLQRKRSQVKKSIKISPALTDHMNVDELSDQGKVGFPSQD